MNQIIINGSFPKSAKQANYKDPELDEYERSKLPGVPLAENDGCMYPLTEGPDNHMFCGEDIAEGRYCKHHAEKCKGYFGYDVTYLKSYDKNIIYHAWWHD